MHMPGTEDEELQRLREALQQLTQEHQSVRDELRVVRTERDLLKERLQASLRKLYAARSEARGGSEQKDLFFNEAEALAPPPAPEQPGVAVAAHRRVKRGRKPLDPALPREVVRHELPLAERICPHDGTALAEIGIEASEQLDIIPQQVRVLRHERVKYACPCCSGHVRTAPAAARLIPKALLSDDALAWVITAKYQDALPLYRQAAILGRFGGDISRNTLAASVVRAGEAVQPLINLLRDELLECRIIHGDETELQVLKEPGRAAQTKSYLWVQTSGSGPPVHLFAYAPSRGGATAQRLYDGVRAGAALITDGYEVYDGIARAHQLVHLGCWAHSRRRFIEAEAALPKSARSPEQPATQFIALIRELYAIEARARELQLDAAGRLRLRQEYSTALLARIEQLLLAHLHAVMPESLLGKALHYLHEQWPKLVCFVDDGEYPIDNNPCENAIRPFVVGRRNWLFADTVGGAHASANLYSLIQTALANEVDPYRYLRAVFATLPTATTVDDYAALLPWNFKQRASTSLQSQP
jgi:transposase